MLPINTISPTAPEDRQRQQHHRRELVQRDSFRNEEQSEAPDRDHRQRSADRVDTMPAGEGEHPEESSRHNRVNKPVPVSELEKRKPAEHALQTEFAAWWGQIEQRQQP